MKKQVNSNIVIEGARIGFRNFTGEEGKFNRKGDRNFCVFFDDNELAVQLEEDGWNMKWLDAREEGDQPQPYLQVSVAYNQIPPNVILITGQGKTRLDEETVNMLDWAEIENTDIIINPYNWEVNGKTGVKAYLRSMYVTIREDEFASKYYDVPDSALGAITEDFED